MPTISQVKTDDFPGESPKERARALARLAALQRLRDQAEAANQQGMLRSLEQLIEQEANALRERDSGKAGPERED